MLVKKGVKVDALGDLGRFVKEVFLLSSVCCLLSAVCCLLASVCCLLSAVCCLMHAFCWIRVILQKSYSNPPFLVVFI
jgi:hypothetical protein